MMRSEGDLIPYSPGRLEGSPVLVLAPHPDDGYSAAVAQLCSSWEPEPRCGQWFSLIAGRREMRILGEPRRSKLRPGSVSMSPNSGDLADRSLRPDDADLADRLRALMIEFAPQLILLPSPAEIHHHAQWRYSSTTSWDRGPGELSGPDKKLSCDREPRSGDRYIAWGVSPRMWNEKILRKPRSGDRNIAVIPAAHGTDRCLSPPPGASCLCVVLTLGLTPRLRICRACGAQIRASLRRVFMEVVRRVPTYFRTRQRVDPASRIQHPASGGWRDGLT